MDVSGWTIAQRMELPDWCFPTRYLIGCYGWNNVAASINWEISNVTLPDPACIWDFGYVALVDDVSSCDFRVGLNDVVPTTVPEMNDVQDFVPNYGYNQAGPNAVRIMPGSKQAVNFHLRLGLVTGGKYLVIENHNLAGTSRFQVYVLVSGLPTQLPAHMDPNTV